MVGKSIATYEHKSIWKFTQNILDSVLHDGTASPNTNLVLANCSNIRGERGNY